MLHPHAEQLLDQGRAREAEAHLAIEDLTRKLEDKGLVISVQDKELVLSEGVVNQECKELRKRLALIQTELQQEVSPNSPLSINTSFLSYTPHLASASCRWRHGGTALAACLICTGLTCAKCDVLLQLEKRERERLQTAKEEIEWAQQRAHDRNEQAQDKLHICNLLQDLKDKEAELEKMRLTLSMPGRSLPASRLDHPRKTITILDQEEAVDSKEVAECFSNRCTIGIMLSGARVDSLVAGGPAYSTTLQKGDQIVLIDGAGVEVDDIPAAIIGDDLPGSIVILTVKKVGSGDIIDVEVVRVESQELTDKRSLFELFTDIENLIGTLHLSPTVGQQALVS